MKKSSELIIELNKLFDELSVKESVEKLKVGKVFFLNIKNHRELFDWT
jgi:hypothetical protein